MNRAGGNIYRRLLGGAGGDELLAKTDQGKTVSDWSHDGKYLAFTSADDIVALPITAAGAGMAIQVTNTPAIESGAVFSRDSRWIAYQVDQTGAGPEVWVQSFPDGVLPG